MKSDTAPTGALAFNHVSSKSRENPDETSRDCHQFVHPFTTHVILLEDFPLHPRIFTIRTYKCPIPIFQWNVWTPTTTTAFRRPTMGNARKQSYVVTVVDIIY